MNELHFPDNILKLRQKRNITQEQLAETVGVTKASVSKWENGQSLPDILLLPKLASFFDVSIDELLGYEPQLSREQIKNLYHQLAAGFAAGPFEEVMDRSRELVKKYYSCYPFLFQVCILWLNHFMLAPAREEQEKILTDISRLCGHIAADCRDSHICNDAAVVRAMVDLQLGRAEEAIEVLEEILNPLGLSRQSDDVLIQAYQAAGRVEEAESFTQICMYLHLLSFVGNAVQYLSAHSGDLAVCEETIRRTDSLIAVNDLENLHPGITVMFHYQAAIIYALWGKTQEALKRLECYAACVERILENSNLHGDPYFHSIEPWFERLEIGSGTPRSKKVISESAMQVLEHPAFAALSKDTAFLRIKRLLLERQQGGKEDDIT